MLVACGTPDKKAQLEKLKKQRSDIEGKIAVLQEEIAKTDTSKVNKKVDITSVPLKAETFKSYIEVQGRVDADESVTLSSEMPGTVTKINVKVGDHVTKGQVLAETDSRALQQQLAAMQTSLALVNQMYEKQKNLWDQKIGTEVQYLSVKAQKEAGESAMNALQEQVRMSRIVSPIDGTVDYMNLKIGQAIAPGMQAISVVNFGNMKVKADVAEAFSSRIKNGDDVIVVFPDMKDSVFSKVHYASRAINPITRTFGVEVNLDNKKQFYPNMVAKLRINDYQSEKPVISLPIKYIQKSSNESYVFVAENGKAMKKTVTLGRIYRGTAEILSGLKEGDLLITQGYDLVNEGDLVNSRGAE
jgi:RND family efflux transporter MFP subunit